MLTTEMHTRAIPALYQRFAKEIGAKHWRNRVAQCNSEIKGNQLLGDYLCHENSIAFQLDHLADLIEQYGRAVPIRMIENPAIYPAVTFAAQIVSLMDASLPGDAARIVRRVHGAFRNPDDMRGLCLELQAATHFLLLGLKICWPESSGIGTFDLLVEGIGRGGLEVECKSISIDKGRKIHTREAIDFHTVLKPHVDQMLSAGLTNGLSVVLTLPGRLPKAPEERVALAGEVAWAVHAGVSNVCLLSGASIQIRDFDPTTLIGAHERGDGSVLRTILDSITGTRNRESMFMGSASGGVVVFTMQSAQDDGWKKAVSDTLNDAAKRQLSGTRAGLLMVAVEGLDFGQLHSIGVDDNASQSVPSKIQDVANTFLDSASRDHIVGVGFVSRSGILSERDGIVRTGGSAYYFRKKQSPFWSDEFKSLYSWSEG